MTYLNYSQTFLLGEIKKDLLLSAALQAVFEDSFSALNRRRPLKSSSSESISWSLRLIILVSDTSKERSFSP
jgi:hypothetical protein